MDQGTPVKFLVVDDVAENLLALEALLAREGLEIHKARSGPEALELLLVHDFALALLDVQMPDMDGYELAELMRGTTRTRRVPILFLTAVATDERRRFRGYAAGAVDYMFKPIDPEMLKAKTAVFFELERQRLELAHQRDELEVNAGALADALGRLQAHGDNSPLATIELDSDLRLVAWSGAAERMFGWRQGEAVGRRLDELGMVADAELDDFIAHLTGLLQGQQARGVHLARNRRTDGSVIDCEWYISALFDQQGRPVSLQAQALDVTERRRAQEVQQLLVGELNHRVKNTLASVQAIASQTLRHAVSPEAFQDAFTGRIQVLARAHSLLSNETWQGAMLADLVQDQLGMGTIDEDRLQVSGPAVRLPAQLALSLALMLHEFITNANKYGALSTTEGRVSLTWSVEGDQLRLQWLETGGRPVKATTRRGFGTRLIEQSTRSAGGEARLSYRADGICWDLVVALPQDENVEPPSSLGALEAVGRAGGVAKASGASNLAGRRLLVVEDEALVALELSALLEQAGVEVIGPASNVREALEFVDRGGFEGVLLDANLGGQPVDEVAAALTRRNIAFVFVSGYGGENLPPGFAHIPHVSKPFKADEVLAAAASLMRETASVHLLPTRSRTPR